MARSCFTRFCCFNLDLDPMTFTLDLYPLKMYMQIKNKLSRPKLSKVIVLQTYIHIYIHTDRETDRQTDR